MRDKGTLVTGAAKGIGEGIVRVLAAEGAILVVVGRNEVDNEPPVSAITAAGGQAGYVTAELADPTACERVVRKVIAQYGRIEGIVNNAGVNDGVGLETGDYQRFMQSLHRNSALLPDGALRVAGAKKVARCHCCYHRQNGRNRPGNTSAYAAANGGRNALTRERAVELLKYSIRVNAVMVAECWTPAYETWITTLPNPEEKLREIISKIPLENRMATAEEIANTTAFLLSACRSHTTGQILHVDGGYVYLNRALANA